MGIGQRSQTVMQVDLFGPTPASIDVQAAIESLAQADEKSRGAIYTKPAIVNFMLDLAGYSPDRDLTQLRLLEPSCGSGRFFLAALDRLLESWDREGSEDPDVLRNCLRGVEVHRQTLQALKSDVTQRLINHGLDITIAQDLSNRWMIQDDFLLTTGLSTFDVVVGNPPYVRQEKLDPALVNIYRQRFTTLYNRADIYIPFYERGLDLLKEEGKLAYICTDRWTKNKYGGPLRSLIAREYHLETYVDLIGAEPFEGSVSTYPAITLLKRGSGHTTTLISKEEVERHVLQSQNLTGTSAICDCQASELQNVVQAKKPWSLDTSGRIDLIRRLEVKFAPLEQEGCKVGIGVATGVDRIFIRSYDDLEVEDSRKLRLATTKDIQDGQIKWQGSGVLNPYDRNGKLVDPDDYPRFKAYIEQYKDVLSARHVARKSPTKWFKTIDRIHVPLAGQSKLLIPDIKGGASIVYENEGLYPHHNLYYITSISWDLRALRNLLLCGIAQLFVSGYSTQMRGGYLRYQAQYLRRICIPAWDQISKETQTRLIDSEDREALQRITFELYGLSARERNIVLTNQHSR